MYSLRAVLKKEKEKNIKKITLLCLCTLLLAAVLTGCGCDHAWTDANCETPKTCSECGETEGEALGHKWLDATTEAPQTCETCGLTEGTPIEVDPRFTTAACKLLFGTWTGVAYWNVEESGVDIPGKDYLIGIIESLTFRNDGTVSVNMRTADDAEEIMTEYMIEVFYAIFAEKGFSREETAANAKETYGMSLEEYVALQVSEMNYKEYFVLDQEMVYYVEDGVIYTGKDWDSEMNPLSFEIREESLYGMQGKMEFELFKE